MNKLFRILFPQKDPQVLREKYDIPNDIRLNVKLTPQGLVATCDDLPGFVTNAKDPQELLEMVNDAILEYFDVPKFEADYVYDKLDINGMAMVYLKRQEQYA